MKLLCQMISLQEEFFPNIVLNHTVLYLNSGYNQLQYSDL